MHQCRWCEGQLTLVKTFTEPPASETDYGLAPYRRQLYQCERCGHVTNEHSMPIADLYSEAYVTATYASKIGSEFARIMALPPATSDNRGRAARVVELARRFRLPIPGDILDVGTGLAVFVAAMAEVGWRCTAVEPDPRAAQHALSIGAAAIHVGDFMDVEVDSSFHVVSFNKVLEHVDDPVAMLARASRNLVPGGFVYVEVPDGEGALMDQEGAEREEFFVEHHCAMSLGSMAILARSSGYMPVVLERIREPSGKYTIWAALQLAR